MQCRVHRCAVGRANQRAAIGHRNGAVAESRTGPTVEDVQNQRTANRVTVAIAGQGAAAGHGHANIRDGGQVACAICRDRHIVRCNDVRLVHQRLRARCDLVTHNNTAKSDAVGFLKRIACRHQVGFGGFLPQRRISEVRRSQVNCRSVSAHELVNIIGGASRRTGAAQLIGIDLYAIAKVQNRIC